MGNFIRTLLLYILAAVLIISCGKSRSAAKSKFPGVDIPLTSGDVINLDSFSEGIIVLSFFEPWCNPCYDELIALKKLEDKFDAGREEPMLRFYGLSLASVTAIQAMCDSIEVSSDNLKLGQVDSSFYIALDVSEVPIWLVLKDGDELLRVTGVHPQVLDSLESFTEHIVFKEGGSDATE